MNNDHELISALAAKAPEVAFAGDYQQYVDAVFHNWLERRLNAVLPDSLNRSLEQRIALLSERADRESKLAVILAQEVPDFHSRLIWNEEKKQWYEQPKPLTTEERALAAPGKGGVDGNF